MLQKFNRSWMLTGQCWRVLKADPALFVFPLLSVTAVLLIIASFAWPVFALNHRLDPVDDPGSTTHTARLLYYFLLGVFYLFTYVVTIFFNCALIAVALRRLDGEEATVGEGLQAALSNISSILGYALIAATVGWLLRWLEDRVGFIGRIVISIIGAAWTIASSMTLPVLVVENAGPVEALTRSFELMKENWGENLIGNSGIGLAIVMSALPFFLIAYLPLSAAIASHKTDHIILAGLPMGALVLGVVLIRTTLHAIYTAALYRFATGAKENAGIDADLLSDAFAPK